MITRSNLILLALIACVAALPLFGGAYALRLGTQACLYAVLALSWNVVGGFAGYPSFATAAFFGFGAYFAGVLLDYGWPLWGSVAAAAVATFLAAGSLGAVLLRLRGHYFAIASLSLAEVLREVVNNATDLTGGGMGLNIPLAAGSGIMADARFFFYAMWFVMLLTAVAVIAVAQTRLGSRSIAFGRTKPLLGWPALTRRSLKASHSGCLRASSPPQAEFTPHGCTISIRPTSSTFFIR
jgi:branched-chain amino acid transport system permease protein